MGEHNDFFVGARGSLWMSVMDVEYQNACFKVEHELFCTNQPSVIKVYVPDQGFDSRIADNVDGPLLMQGRS